MHKANLKKIVFIVCSIVFLFLIVHAAVDDYHVGIGDVLKVEVLGEPDFSGSMEVNTNGAITLKLVGDVKVAGLTLSEIKDKLVDILGKDYLRNPKIKVEIVGYKSKKIVILGEVQKPGEYYLKHDNVSILDVISMSGGLSDKAADIAIIFRKNIKKETKNFDKIEINIRDLLMGKSNPGDILVLPGDIVNFPSKREDSASYQVYIEGKVRSPGVYDYHKGMTVFELCLKAGGFLPFSAENRAQIIRQKDGKVIKIKVNIKKIKQGKIPDVELKPGDKVIIPGSWF